MLRQALILLLLCLTLPFGTQASATNIRASLVMESDDPAPGTPVLLAIRMQPKPGWHGYWVNPGDAGQPPQLDWQVPSGVTIGPMRYPVPETLLISGLMNHVYNHDYALLTRVTLPKGISPGTAIPISLKGSWLACTDRICVPERAELMLTVTAGMGTIKADRRTQFDSWQRALPRPLGSPAHYELGQDALRIAIPYPADQPAPKPWFYAESEHALAYAAPQQVARAGDLLIVTAQRTDGPTPPTIKGVLALGDGRGFAIEATPGSVPAPESGLARSILMAFGGALLGGLLLNLMPCVFPVISLKALGLARASESERAARTEALAYAAGVIFTCLALGGALLGLRAAGVTVGWAFQLQNPWVIALLLLLCLAITANLLGLIHINAFGGGQALASKSGARGAFWTGVLAAFVATPCTGPFMAAALGAALVLPTAAALAIFAGLGIGMAIPFLLIGFVPALRRRLPRPGAWMQNFQRILAIPMLLTALALGWLLWRQVSPPAVTRSAQAGIAFSESALSTLRQQGKPVFLYFTADWCLTCKVNEAAAIDRAEVQAAFRKAGVTVMVGDWTNGDPAITRFLDARGRSGVPLYLWYGASGEPVELPQILTPGLLTARAAQPRPR